MMMMTSMRKMGITLTTDCPPLLSVIVNRMNGVSIDYLLSRLNCLDKDGVGVVWPGGQIVGDGWLRHCRFDSHGGRILALTQQNCELREEQLVQRVK